MKLNTYPMSAQPDHLCLTHQGGGLWLWLYMNYHMKHFARRKFALAVYEGSPGTDIFSSSWDDCFSGFYCHRPSDFTPGVSASLSRWIHVQNLPLLHPIWATCFHTEITLCQSVWLWKWSCTWEGEAWKVFNWFHNRLIHSSVSRKSTIRQGSEQGKAARVAIHSIPSCTLSALQSTVTHLGGCSGGEKWRLEYETWNFGRPGLEKSGDETPPCALQNIKTTGFASESKMSNLPLKFTLKAAEKVETFIYYAHDFIISS